MLEKRLFIKGELDVGISPRYIRLLEEIRKNTDPCYPYALQKKADYLYQAWFQNIDYKFAEDYYLKNGDLSPVPACSSIRKGNLFARSFDWTYNEQVGFIVHTPHLVNRNAVLGVAANIPYLTPALIKAEQVSDYYKLIPFQIVDGINEHKLAVSVNVVPTDYGLNHIMPQVEVRSRVSASMLVRFILDRFKTVDEAIEYLKKYTEIYESESIHKMHYEHHYLISDEEKSVVLGFCENELYVLDVSDAPYITNFHKLNVNFNEDGTVYTPQTRDEEHSPITTNNITPFGAGLERFNIIVSRYESISTVDQMAELLKDIRYTHAYPSGRAAETDPIWYSEFVDHDLQLTVDSLPQDFSEILSKINEAFLNRSRNAGSKYFGTWHSEHSSIYNLSKKTLRIYSQEAFDEYYEITLDGQPEQEGEPELQELKAVHAVGHYDEDGNPVKIDEEFLPDALGQPKLQELKELNAVGQLDEDGNPIKIDEQFLPDSLGEPKLQELKQVNAVGYYNEQGEPVKINEEFLPDSLGEPKLQELKELNAVGQLDEDGNPIKIDQKFLPQSMGQPELQQIKQVNGVGYLDDQDNPVRIDKKFLPEDILERLQVTWDLVSKITAAILAGDEQIIYDNGGAPTFPYPGIQDLILDGNVIII